MEKSWIAAPAPRKCRVVLTAAGSIVLHGAIIAVAALWPVHYTAPARELPPTIIDYNPPGNDDPAPPTPENNPTPPAVPSDPSPLEVDTATDTPPTPEEPTIEITTPSKPLARSVAGKLRLVHPASTGATAHGNAPTVASGVGAGLGRPGATGRWLTPRPPYLYAMRAAHIAGSGSVRVTTDGTGRVTSASIVQSTGNALLDDNTCRFARTDWSGPPNAAITVPITYQMK